MINCPRAQLFLDAASYIYEIIDFGRHEHVQFSASEQPIQLFIIFKRRWNFSTEV